MPTLFADIDNTLIYSHRHTITSPKRVVEFLNGKEQSYMTEFTYSFLTGKHGLQIVPVTTRTLPQYLRLENLIQELGCEYSRICNGAILLHHMQIDQDWYEESLELASTEISEILNAEKWLINNCGFTSTHSTFGLFVYAKTSDSGNLAAALQQHVDTDKVDILFDHNKTYCIPKSMNKGSAIKRFSQRFNVTASIAAGDSEFDIPMLNQAKIAIIPQELFAYIQNKKAIVCKLDSLFSDEVCRVITEISP